MGEVPPALLEAIIYGKSETAGERVMEGVKRHLTKKLKLKVNETKSAVAQPKDRIIPSRPYAKPRSRQ